MHFHSDLGHELKDDARKVVELTYARQLFTGEIAQLAKVPGKPPAQVRILLLDSSDTEEPRLSKWRMKKAFREEMPDELTFFTTGYQAGSVPDPLPV